MKSATEKMDSVEVGNGIDDALRIGRTIYDALLAEREGFEKLSVEQQERILTRTVDLLELLGEIERLLRARMLPRQVAHHNATVLSKRPGEKSH